MPFRVAARTLLHLGAELISSDGIAFYELIKNAYDAGSKRVVIDVATRIPYNIIVEASQAFRTDLTDVALEELKRYLQQQVDASAPLQAELREQIMEAHLADALHEVLKNANYISIQDTGEGMTLRDLQQIYLTIGTPNRLRKRQERLQSSQRGDQENQAAEPILGEKGVGRLAAMRLGTRLKVTTSKTGESRFNELDIDWSHFSRDPDALVEDVDVTPRHGAEKPNSASSGTIIRIFGLVSEWSRVKVASIASQQFSKLFDPFTPSAHYPITLRFNGVQVAIPPFDRLVLEYAHATASATYSVLPEPVLEGYISYRLYQKDHTFKYQLTDISSFADAPTVTLRSLGPFTMQAYWFNRRRFNTMESVGDLARVKELVAHWGGGLMLYRDGFRVNPYGSPEDDWLHLDQKALASSGYKVNRQQIIGKVSITSSDNRSLIDQTNREGLRDCDEKQALINILRKILVNELRGFLDMVDREIKSRQILSLDELEERIETHEEQIEQGVSALARGFPQIENTGIVSRVNDSLRQIRVLLAQAKQLADHYEDDRGKLLNLAGQGLMVETIAHELNRATAHTLKTLVDTRRDQYPPQVRTMFRTLESQLETLRKRLRILDPLSTAGRQSKETFYLASWIREIIGFHSGQFERHQINCTIRLDPSDVQDVQLRAVKGMIVQVLENLISNSVYWLRRRKLEDHGFSPEIVITIYTSAREIHFADNGPGIDPFRSETIFEPFETTKRVGEGKGMGLFISREIAIYNGAQLFLSDKPTVHPNKLNTFVFAVGAEE